MLKKLKNKMKDQRGLTLIELLAVIVILGIIAGIAIPSITKVIDNTKEKAKVAEALQIIDAARLAYADDSSKTSWSSTDSKNDLANYVSKLKDKTWTVTYDSSTNSYSITGHVAAQVVDKDKKDTDAVSEDDLATKAK